MKKIALISILAINSLFAETYIGVGIGVPIVGGNVGVYERDYNQKRYYDNYGNYYGFFDTRGYFFNDVFYYYDSRYTYYDRLYLRGLFRPHHRHYSIDDAPRYIERPRVIEVPIYRPHYEHRDYYHRDEHRNFDRRESHQRENRRENERNFREDRDFKQKETPRENRNDRQKELRNDNHQNNNEYRERYNSHR